MSTNTKEYGAPKTNYKVLIYNTKNTQVSFLAMMLKIQLLPICYEYVCIVLLSNRWQA
jgi:hypothetical protein